MSLRAIRRRPRGWLKDRGLYAWLPLPGYAFQERSSPSTASGHGDPVGTVNEYTGVGPALIAPSDAARPTMKVSGNSRYLDYDGSTSDLRTSSLSTLTANLTFLTVALPTNFSTYRCLMSQTTGGIPKPNDWYLTTGTGVPQLFRGDGSGFQQVSASSAPSTSTPQVLRVQVSGNNITHYLDGATNGTGTMTITPTDSGIPFSMGIRADAFVLWLGRRYADVVHPSASISAADARDLENWLRHLAGI